METTINATMTSTPARRTVLLALTLAFLLTGLAAAPVGATPRSETVKTANSLIDGCFFGGGDPVVIMDSTGTEITVACVYPDGVVVYCNARTSPTVCYTTRPASVQQSSTSLGTIPTRGSRSQLTLVGTTMQIRPGTHLELSGDRLIVVADNR